MHGKSANCAMFARLINKKLQAADREASECQRARFMREFFLGRGCLPWRTHAKRLCEVESNVHGVADLRRKSSKGQAWAGRTTVAGLPAGWRTRAGSRAADGADSNGTWLAACSAASRERGSELISCAKRRNLHRLREHRRASASKSTFSVSKLTIRGQMTSLITLDCAN